MKTVMFGFKEIYGLLTFVMAKMFLDSYDTSMRCSRHYFKYIINIQTQFISKRNQLYIFQRLLS